MLPRRVTPVNSGDRPYCWCSPFNVHYCNWRDRRHWVLGLILMCRFQWGWGWCLQNGDVFKSNAAGVDKIPLSLIKSLLPVWLGTLTHVYNHIFTCSQFSARWRALAVLPIPKVAVLVKFTDYRPISVLACLSKVFDVLLARHIWRNELLTVYQSGFRCHHINTARRL
jgi:hypothetical protein